MKKYSIKYSSPHGGGIYWREEETDNLEAVLERIASAGKKIMKIVQHIDIPERFSHPKKKDGVWVYE